MSVAKGIFKGVTKSANEFVEAGYRFGVLGVLDEAMAKTIQPVFGVVTGTASGLMGKGLNLTNASGLSKITHTLGWGAGRVSVGITKPLFKTGGSALKNTGADLVNWSRRAGNFGRKVADFGFEKTTEGGMNSLLGYRAKKRTARVLMAGAVGIGVTSGMGEARYNTGLKTAVNGIMNTQGVAITPGSVNPSYTPVKRVNNHGATGELPLALHRQRNTGYL